MNSRTEATRTTKTRARSFRAVIAIALAWAVWSPATAAGTFYVDGTNPSCSNAGPGTEATPYCGILKAAQAQGGPGTTILVKPGIYREKVTVPASGSPVYPFVIKALGPGVIVDGADDLSQPGLWSPATGNVWVAAGVDWNARQVFLDGARLVPSTAAPASLPMGSFRWIDGQGLYVNIGGSNPGLRQIHAGRRANGFRLNGASWVTIEGFTVTRADDIGIYMLGGCTGNSIIGNTATFARNNGIGATACTDLMVANNIVHDNTDHGIYFWNGTNDSILRGNEAFRNARSGDLGANGIKVESSERNLVESNRAYENQDSGIQINLSLDSISRYNVSYRNGDHGFDQLGSTGTRHMGDIACHNYRDGFSIEGGNQDIQVSNSIAVDNGLATGNHNLYVDTTSTVAFVSDFNIFWNSNSQSPISFNGVDYTAVTDFSAATGLDANSLEVNPHFVDAAAGDFRFQMGSPAIDSADSSPSEFTMTDAMGHPRVDDPMSPNDGAGPFPYADRGAFEFDMDCFGDTGSACGASGVGECSLGTTQCVDGVLVCSGTAGPTAEVCDGLDNDCDGAADNAPSGTIRMDITGGVLTTLAWESLTGATGYDIVSGDLGLLAATGGDFEAATTGCLAEGLAATSMPVSSSPVTGTGMWFLVRGRACGGPGTWDGPGPGQIPLRDAGINAASSSCN